MSIRMTFSRPLQRPDGYPLAPLASVLTDGVLTALVHTSLVPDASPPDGQITFSIQLSPLLTENQSALIEVVLGSRADLLWTNRERLGKDADPLFVVLNPPPPQHHPITIRSFRLDSEVETAQLVALRFLETLGRLPDRASMLTLSERLRSGDLTPERLTRQLVRSAEAQETLTLGAFLPDSPTAAGPLALLADAWVSQTRRQGTHPPPLFLVRNQAPQGARFSDSGAGIHLRPDNGIAYEDGWFGPQVSFITEFDRGHGILAFDIWRPGLARDDVAVLGGGDGFDIEQQWSDDRLSVAIISHDVNVAGFEIVARTPFAPDNDDERNLGFLIDAPRAILDERRLLTDKEIHGQ